MLRWVLPTRSKVRDKILILITSTYSEKIKELTLYLGSGNITNKKLINFCGNSYFTVQNTNSSKNVLCTKSICNPGQSRKREKIRTTYREQNLILFNHDSLLLNSIGGSGFVNKFKAFRYKLSLVAMNVAWAESSRDQSCVNLRYTWNEQVNLKNISILYYFRSEYETIKIICLSMPINFEHILIIRRLISIFPSDPDFDK